MGICGVINIREIKPSDAEDFLALCKQLDDETKFMLLEPGERTTTSSEQEESIRQLLTNKQGTILVAEGSGHLLGYVGCKRGSYRRNQHKADIVIGVALGHTGQGLGTRLLITIEQWARSQQLHKLELTVMAHNVRAIKLYKKMGFVVEGVSVDSLLVDGRYVDELDMAKILQTSEV